MTHHIQLIRDGNAWIALLGRNLQEGTAGVGDTPAEALRDLADKFESERVILGKLELVK